MTVTNNNANTATFNIQFRSKFQKLVTDANRQPIMDAFEKFCNLSPATTETRDILWELTYSYVSSESILKEMNLNHFFIYPEDISKLRNELRYQYELLHKGHFTIVVPEECNSAFKDLVKKSDQIIASVVYFHCFSHIAFNNVKRTLFLLSGTSENYFYGGIRALGFSQLEADFLKPFYMEIHNLLKAMYEHQQKAGENTPIKKLDDTSELPFTFGEEIRESQENEIHEEEPANSDSSFKELTPKTIMEYKDLFSTFVESNDMNNLLQIGNIGFDLNNVIAKKETIKKIIDANAILADAERELIA